MTVELGKTVKSVRPEQKANQPRVAMTGISSTPMMAITINTMATAFNARRSSRL
jgi:hypothetical protein